MATLNNQRVTPYLDFLVWQTQWMKITKDVKSSDIERVCPIMSKFIILGGIAKTSIYPWVPLIFRDSH